MLGLSRPPPRSAAWLLNLPLSRNLGLRGWHICLRSFHLCFLLDSREKGEAVPGQEQGSQAPAFPSGLQPCCISSNPVLVGFTAPGAALGGSGPFAGAGRELGEALERGLGWCWVGRRQLEPPMHSMVDLCHAGRPGAAGTSSPYPSLSPSRPEHPALLPGPELELRLIQARTRQQDAGPGGAASPALIAAPHGA